MLLINKGPGLAGSLFLTYQFKPGTALSLDRLSGSLGMSQTPIREALSRLWQEHFVERQGAKGYLVSSLNAPQIQELYELRIILEVPGIRRTARFIEKNGLAELARILKSVESLIGNQRRAETIALDREFHAVILKQSRNRLLGEIGENVLDRVCRVQNLNVLTSDRLHTAQKHHLEILDALGDKDENRAAGLMEKHLISAKEYILARLRDDDDILRKLLT